MRQELLAYGYKPSDLVQITAQDVLDFKRGLSARLEFETNIIFTAAEIAAKTKERRQPGRDKYSAKVRQMIEEADKKDKQAGKIKSQ